MDAILLIIGIVYGVCRLLNLDPDIVRSGPRLHSTCSKQHGGSASSSAIVTTLPFSLRFNKCERLAELSNHLTKLAPGN
jgi:hypothetical protein